MNMKHLNASHGYRPVHRANLRRIAPLTPQSNHGTVSVSAPLAPVTGFHRVLAARCGFPFRLRRVLRSTLLSATALVAVAAPGWAETIDGGDVEIVDGRGLPSDGAGGTGTQSSPWVIFETLYVGATSTGELKIIEGGTVSNEDNSYIGNSDGSTGTVTVTGEGSSWDITDTFYVGNNGTGTLTIADGGTVSNEDNSYIGNSDGSTGTVTVTGEGSSWDITDTFYVGNNGTGTLTIADGGTVDSSSRTYIGNFQNATGTVSVTGEDSSWENTGDLFVGNSGTGTLTIAKGGELEATQVDVAFRDTSSGTLNIGAAAGDTAVAAGTLKASTVKFGDGTGKLVFNHTDTDYTFAAAISGAGSVNVLSGTTKLTGSNNYSGGTTISGGTLVVNGSTGAITLNGGTLGGSGTVGAVAVNSGGTFAPGNSIGTIAAGNTVFNAGSSYAVEVNADGDSDLLNVTGTVTINDGATLKIAPETKGKDGSTYAKSTDYTIIKASSGVTGTFGTVTDSFAFLDAEVSYDPNKVNLKLTRNNVALKDLATTSNQVATANAVDGLGSGSALYDAVVALEDDKVEAAYDSMSGEAHASAKSFLFQNDAAIAGNILGHMRDTSATGPAPAVTRGIPAPSRDTWGTVFGFQAKTEETTDAAEMKRSGGGALAGVNLMTSPDLQLGVTLGVSRSEYDITGRQSSGTANAAHLGIYGSTQRGPVNLRFGATYGYHKIKSERSVTVGATTNELSASYKAQSATLFAEASYGVAQFEPFINASYTMLDTDGFTESGGASALTVDAASQDMVLATLGVRATHDIMFGPNYASLAWSVGWQHAAGDLVSQMDAAFDGSAKFRIEGVPIATNTAVITAGLNVDLGASTNIGFGYTGQFSKGAQRHTLLASLTKSF